MFLYEINKKDQERKYLVAALDTQEARDLVIERFLSEFDTTLVRADLKAGFPDESATRRRRLPFQETARYSGHKYKVTAWDMYQDSKKRGHSVIITNYLF